MFWIVAVIIVGVVCSIIDDGGPFSKTVLACAVIAIACALLSWITGIGFLMTLVKGCGVVAVLAILIPILLAIFGK